jgi:hypothetical protein
MCSTRHQNIWSRFSQEVSKSYYSENLIFSVLRRWSEDTDIVIHSLTYWKGELLQTTSWVGHGHFRIGPYASKVAPVGIAVLYSILCYADGTLVSVTRVDFILVRTTIISYISLVTLVAFWGCVSFLPEPGIPWRSYKISKKSYDARSMLPTIEVISMASGLICNHVAPSVISRSLEKLGDTRAGFQEYLSKGEVEQTRLFSEQSLSKTTRFFFSSEQPTKCTTLPSGNYHAERWGTQTESLL